MQHPLRKARIGLGYTQKVLADFVQVSESTIKRAEAGKPLRVDNIHLICRYFSDRYNRQVEPQELGLISAEAEEEPVESEMGAMVEKPDAGNSEDIDRRGVLQWLKNAGITIVATPLVAPHLPPFTDVISRSSTTKVTNEEWEHLKTLVETCWQLSKGNILQIVEPTLWAYLPRLAEFATTSSKNQALAATITSQAYLLAAILAGHRDDLDARQRLSEQALSYASLAHDRNLQVASLRQLALTYDYKNRPGKALQTYQDALPLLKDTSPLLYSRMYAGLAGSYAQFNQHQEALRSLGMAYDSFPAKPEEDPSFLYADCEYFTLVLWEGLTYLDLGQAKGAAEAFEKIDGMQPKVKVPERVRIEFLTYQAETFIASRNLEQGSAYLEEAVKASLALGSERRYSQASEVYQKMRLVWPYEAKVKALGALFQK